MRLYKVTYDLFKSPARKGDEGGGKWENDKEKYVIASAARDVTMKYEERDDTRFKTVELIADNVEEIEN